VTRRTTQRRKRAERRSHELAHRTVDEVDPPAWELPPPDATGLVVRCHELRRKRLDELTVEDLRLGIGQQIALAHLVPLAIGILRENPLAEGAYYRGDLLSAALHVDGAFWERNGRLAADLRSIVERLDHVPREVVPAIEEFRSLVDG
jgi:hypothetical protein